MTERAVVVKLKAEVSAFKSAMSEATAATDATAKATTKAGEAASAAAAKVNRAAKEQADAAGRLRVAEAQLAEARSKYGQTSAQVIAAEEKVAKARRDQDAATKALTAAENAHRVAAGDAAKASEKAETASARLVRSAQDQGEAWNTAGFALTAFGAVAVGAFGAAVKAAIDWESAWTGVTKTVNASDEELAQIEEGLRGLTAVLPASHDEIASVAEAAGQLGVQTTSIVDFTKTMLQLGQTTNLTSDEAATSIAQMMNVMDSAPQDVGRLAATLVALGNSGASTEKSILSMATRIAGAGKLVGASEGEVLALSSTLADLGIQAELGGGVTTRVLLKLYSAVQGGGPILDKFAAVAGQSAEEFAAAFRESPVAALDAVAQGLTRVEASGGNVVQTLGSLGFEATEDLRVLLSLKGAGDALAKSLDLQGQAWEQASALAQEADKRNATAAAQIQISMNQIQEAAIDAGAVFVPVAAEIAGAIGGMAKGFASLPGPAQAAIAGFGGVAGATTLAAGAFALLLPRALDTYRAFQQLKAVNPAVAGGMRGVALGVTKASFAIGAIVTSLDLLSKHLDSKLVNSTQEWTTALEGLSKADIGELPKQFDELGRQLDLVLEPSRFEKFRNGATAWISPWATDMERAKETTAGLDAALKNMVSVDANTAAEAYWQTLERMNLTAAQGAVAFPEYNKAIQESSKAQAEAAATASDASTAWSTGIAEMGSTAEDAAEKLKEWRDMVSESDAGFVDLMGAYDAVIEKNREMAEETADATKSSKDSWEDYYDGQTVSFEDFLQQLKDQVKAQTDWEKNIKSLVGRVSDETIDYLVRLGPAAAPLVAQMVKQSDAKLREFGDLAGQRGAEAVSNFTDELLAARTPTFYVDANTDPALAAALSAVNEINRQNAEITVYTRLSSTVPKALNDYKSGHATGGAISGPGTGTSDSILSYVSNGEHVLTASDVTKMGGQESVYRFRSMVQAGMVQGYASGGAVGRAERAVDRARRAYARARGKDEKDDAREELREAKDRLERVRDLERDLRVDLRRGEIRDSVTGGIGGAYSTIDELRDLSRNKDLSRGQRESLADAARKAEPALKKLYTQADKIEKALEGAADRLADLQQVRDSVASDLSGRFSFSDSVADARRFDDGPNGTIRERIDTKVVIGEAKAYAAKLRTLAARLETLRKLGMPASLLQEIAALGPDQGIPVADSWIASGKGDIVAISAAYKDIDRYATSTGTVITDAMFKGGIAGAKAIVDGLEHEQDRIEKAILKIAKKLENALSKAIRGAAAGGSSKSSSLSLSGGVTAAQAVTASTTRIVSSAQALSAGGSSTTNVYQLDNAAAMSYARGVAVEVATVQRRNEAVLLRG